MKHIHILNHHQDSSLNNINQYKNYPPYSSFSIVNLNKYNSTFQSFKQGNYRTKGSPNHNHIIRTSSFYQNKLHLLKSPSVQV